MKLFRIILWVQTVYYVFTAVWALVDIKSFMEISGPKTDVWLVKTVSVLLLAVSTCFIAHIFIKSDPWPAIILAVSCCIVLAIIDFYYAGNKIIAPVYFIDGILQVILLSGWLAIIIKIRKRN